MTTEYIFHGFRYLFLFFFVFFNFTDVQVVKTWLKPRKNKKKNRKETDEQQYRTLPCFAGSVP